MAVLAPVVAIAASPFDGTYTGMRTTTWGECNEPEAAVPRHVKDGQLVLTQRNGVRLIAHVARWELLRLHENTEGQGRDASHFIPGKAVRRYSCYR